MDLEPEQNAITRQWKAHNVSNKNALESQALIHLKNNYCSKRKCLDCAVGVKLLRE
jgi:transposase